MKSSNTSILIGTEGHNPNTSMLFNAKNSRMGLLIDAEDKKIVNTFLAIGSLAVAVGTSCYVE